MMALHLALLAILSISILQPEKIWKNKLLGITEGVLENVLVEQSFETNMLVYGDEKQCELHDWKHFTSEWTSLQKTPKGEYKCKRYSQQERHQFPKFDLTEIKKAVSNQCSEICYQGIKDAETIDENNSAVRISHYFIRITENNKKTGELVQKSIRVDNPAGC